MVYLNWSSCGDSTACPLTTLKLDAIKSELEGVYVIWHTGTVSDTTGEIIPHAVRVGQGNIIERLTTHRANLAITEFEPAGLFVAWAEVPSEEERNGIERFLGTMLVPLVGDAFPDVAPIEVNLPVSGIYQFPGTWQEALVATAKNSAKS